MIAVCESSTASRDVWDGVFLGDFHRNETNRGLRALQQRVRPVMTAKGKWFAAEGKWSASIGTRRDLFVLFSRTLRVVVFFCFVSPRPVFHRLPRWYWNWLYPID